jgi:flagellar biosynthesis protein FlhB
MSEGDKDDGQEKSQDASPARMEKARRDGDVSQSKELNAAASYIGLYLAIILAGGAVSGLATVLSSLLKHPQTITEQALNASGGVFIQSLWMDTMNAVSLFFFLPALASLLALIAQRAITFAPSKISPKFSRLSLTANAKKKYGPQGLAEFAKSSVKLLVIFTLFGAFFMQRFSSLPADVLSPATALPGRLLEEVTLFAGIVVVFSVGLAAIDLPWSQHQHAKRLRMTHEDAKKESKENDGDPTMKQNRRERAQAISQNKMLHDVPNANVVIVNPTHYAVALAWDREAGAAPICIAKGADELAARIREIAAVSGVPIQSDPPSARAIFASVDVGEEIQRDHYAAVAAAIHFADRIREKAKFR